MEKRKFYVSTDSSGLCGFPETWRRVWLDPIMSDPALKDRFAGFEMLAWSLARTSGWVENLLQRSKECGVPIAAMHGRMGVNRYSSRINAVQNELLLPTSQLLKHGNGLDYLLVHEPEAVKPEVFVGILQNKQSFKRLYVENYADQEGFDRALCLAQRMQGFKVPAGVMVDVVHFGVRGQHPYEQWRAAWDLMMANVSQLLDQGDVPVGIHFPVGTYPGDSLPLDTIDDCMLRDFAGLTEGRIEGVTIENQQLGRQNFWLTRAEVECQRDRNVRILERLSRVGII